MKTLQEMHDEFRKSLELTSLQRSSLVERLKKEDIELTAGLQDISEGVIEVYPPPSLQDLRLTFYYSGDRFREQLIEFHKGDEVQLVARLLKAHGNSEATYYEFSLKTVTRLRTTEDIQKERDKSAATTKTTTTSDGPCFIATASFGSSDPILAILRAYRDQILLKTIPGRLTVWVYYRVSPSVARFVSVSSRRKRVARLLLSPLVAIALRRLQLKRS